MVQNGHMYLLSKWTTNKEKVGSENRKMIVDYTTGSGGILKGDIIYMSYNGNGVLDHVTICVGSFKDPTLADRICAHTNNRLDDIWHLQHRLEPKYKYKCSYDVYRFY